MYTVHCTLYTVHSTLFTLHCTLYIVHCTLYTLQCTLYTLHSTLYTLHSTLYTTLHAQHSTLLSFSKCNLTFGYIGELRKEYVSQIKDILNLEDYSKIKVILLIGCILPIVGIASRRVCDQRCYPV